MNSIILRKDGFYSKEYDEQTGISSLVRTRGPICIYFQDVVEVEKGVTVENFMRALIEHESDIDAMFFGFSKGHKIRPFYEEMQTKPINKRVDISFVEIGWVADYYGGSKIGQPNELLLSIHVSGVYKKKNNNETSYYTLTQAALNDWKHLPISLCDIMSVTDFRINEKNSSGVTETRVINLLEAKKEITLYDFIGGFIDSITWYGYPEHRLERANDIEMAVAGAINVEEMTMEDKEYELKNAIAREDYERAAVLKKEMDNMRKISNKS